MHKNVAMAKARKRAGRGNVSAPAGLNPIASPAKDLCLDATDPRTCHGHVTAATATAGAQKAADPGLAASSTTTAVVPTNPPVLVGNMHKAAAAVTTGACAQAVPMRGKRVRKRSVSRLSRERLLELPAPAIKPAAIPPRKLAQRQAVVLSNWEKLIKVRVSCAVNPPGFPLSIFFFLF